MGMIIHHTENGRAGASHGLARHVSRGTQGEFLRTRFFRPLVLGGILMLAACGESPSGTSPPPASEGRMAFTYDSPDPRLQGTFAAKGPPPRHIHQQGGWAVGLSRSPAELVDMHAAGVGDRASGYANILLRDRMPGTAPIRAECQVECVYMAFDATITENNLEYDYWCRMTEGTVTVVSRSGGRVRGTFSGAGNCTSPMAAATTIRVSRGTFDLAVLPDLPL